ncbi:hypothetical protein C2845_PM14G04240 [Panicum miliaceum]|uniref:Uncharacterized protein n=1 Tax=Panicum miliaceum TaxID=4540 RepID=A0A3L6PPI7_PANMI|nr:hypothetical protein C2845_PM14G04240 [Panicum miliaceum]
MYKPVAVNEGIHRMECRSCHANFSYKGGQLWRDHKSCKAKEALGPSQQQQNADLRFVLVNEIDPHPLDRIPPDSLDDIDLVSHTQTIRDWNLDQKLLSLTSDSEIRDDVRTSKLKDFLIQRKCLPIGGELYNTACLDDVLNSSIVSKGQPMLNLAGDILERFIQAHMSLPMAKQQLIEVVTNMKLKCLGEDAKWWHKIYFGLEVLLDFKKSFPSKELLPAEDTKTVVCLQDTEGFLSRC